MKVSDVCGTRDTGHGTQDVGYWDGVGLPKVLESTR
jgi:hypothetical protein